MQPTAEPEVVAVEPEIPLIEPRPTLTARIAERLPEIIIEALFTLVAVVLAFAVEEWREERELDGRAEEARLAILQEVRRNRDELLESRQQTVDAIAALEASLAPPAQDAPAPGHVAINLELALLSSAAWTTAQSTEASRRMDYAWTLRVSQAYELQAMYQDAQWAAAEALVTFRTSSDEAKQDETARALLGRVRLLTSLGEALEDDYESLL